MDIYHKADDELILKVKSIEAVDYSKTPQQFDRRSLNAVRIYRNSPQGATVQLRVKGAIDERRRGKERIILATASYLGLEEVNEMIEVLTNIKKDFEMQAAAIAKHESRIDEAEVEHE